MFKKETQHKVTGLCRQLGIDDSTALSLLDQVYDSELKYQWGKNEVAVGVVAVAVRVDQIPIEVKEIASEMGIKDSVAFSVTKGIKERAGLNNIPVPPEMYVDRIAEEDGLSDEMADTAKDIIDKAGSETQGKSPTSVAVAALYLASRMHNEGYTQEELAGDRVTVQCVRRRHKGLSEAVSGKI